MFAPRTILSVFLLACLANSAFGFVFSKAAKLSVGLQASARTLSRGNYYIENVKTGQRISFSRTKGHPDLGLNRRGSHMQLSVVKDNWMRIEADSSGKCFSAQWDFDHGFNHAATLYACCPSAKNCDNGNKKDGPLRFQKQSYLLVPVKASIVSRVTSAIQSVVGKRSEESESGPDFEPAPSPSLPSRMRMMSKRATSGKFYIVAVDHITDMTTRVVTAHKKVTAGNYVSLALTEMDASNKYQQWIITKA